MSEGKERKVIKAYAVQAAGKPVEEFSYEAIPLKPEEVEIAIEACGVCHSDLHQAQNDWGVANFPLVAGHEIIGEVIAVGEAVKGLKIGQRVGVGPQTGSCTTCRDCARGEEELCGKKLKSYNSPTGDVKQPHTYGGFAEHIRVLESWAFPIPDGLPSVQAAPLLCAGITTWTPFVHNKVKAGDKVGIIGMGGLGHVAIQFAAKMGCHVTVLSTSASKEAEAKSFGAEAFLSTSDAKAMDASSNSFDFLLSTVSANIAWDPYLKLLRPDGILCMVGLPSEVKFTPMLVVGKRLTVCGSYLASNAEIRNMLQFCVDKNVVAQTESMDLSAENCNIALKKVHENTARYRVVLVNKDFKSIKTA